MGCPARTAASRYPLELPDEFRIGRVLPGEPAVPERARPGGRGRNCPCQPDLHGDARPRTDAHPVEFQIALVKGHAPGQESAARKCQLFQPVARLRRGILKASNVQLPPAIGEHGRGGLGEKAASVPSCSASTMGW